MIKEKLNQQQTDRIEEIKFYIFSFKFMKLCNRLREYRLEDFFNIIAELTETDSAILFNAAITLKRPQSIPNEVETAVALKYLDVSIRDANAYDFLTTRKYTSSIKMYEEMSEAQRRTLLTPRLDAESLENITKFNKKIKEIFIPIYHILNYNINDNDKEEAIEYGLFRH